MSTSRNMFRSSRATLRRGSQFLPVLLMVGALVLGPLALVAYAWGGKGGGHGKGGKSPSAVGGGYGSGKGGRRGARPNWGVGGGHGPRGGKRGGHGPRGGNGGSQGSGTPGAGTGSGSGGGTTTPDPGTGTGGGTGSGDGTTTPGTGGGTTSPGADGGVDSGGSGGSGTPAGGGGSGTTPGGSGGEAPKAPTGGVVTEESGDGDGKEHSSKGKKGSGGKSGAGSSAVNAVQTSAVRPTVAVKPLLGAIASGDDSKKSSSGKGESSSSKKSEKPDKLQERTTIARAVDGIPLLFRAALLALIFATSILAVVSFRERRRATAVARVAQLDHLTGLANREGFDRQMAIEWQRALRHGRPLGLVFVDLDHFKSFNDTHGHVAGDRLLREVAAAITATSRASDFTARLGGDEFVVLCPDTDEDGLARLIERLRIEAAGMAVTLSIGAAGKLDSDQSPDELVHRADIAMYQSKGGRRRGSSSANPMLGSLRRG